MLSGPLFCFQQVDYWLHVLDNKVASLPDVLAAFSDSAENKDAVADLIANGILFTPWQG